MTQTRPNSFHVFIWSVSIPNGKCAHPKESGMDHKTYPDDVDMCPIVSILHEATCADQDPFSGYIS